MIRAWWAMLSKERDAVAAYWIGAPLLGVSWAAESALGLVHPGPPRADLLDNLTGWAMPCALYAFALGLAVGAAEHRAGTIEVIDGLPVGRFRVFAAKLLAAAPLLGLLVAQLVLVRWAVLALGAPPHLASVGPALAGVAVLIAAYVACHFGLGLALSWLGDLGWGVLVLGYFSMLMLSIPVPTLRPYGPLFAEELSLAGGRLHLPVGPVVFWSVLAVEGVLVSAILFLGPGDRLVAARSAAAARARAAVIGGGALLWGGFTALSLLACLVTFAPRLLQPTRIARTEHFRVLYRTDEEDHAAPLIAEVDALSAKVGAVLGNPEPIDVDLELIGAARYHAGVFTGGKIRMGAENGIQTLAHEMAHAHAFALQGWRRRGHENALRFFNEGLASWVEGEVTGREHDRRLAALLWRLGHASFELLADDRRRNARFDLVEAYPLGEVFVAALVDVGGPDAPACVLRALADTDPRPVAGIGLWHRLLGACGHRPDEIVERYESLLAEAAEALPAVLPELRASQVREGRTRWLAVTDRNELDWPSVCRFRDDEDTPVNQLEQRAVRRGRCEIPLWRLSGSSFQVQLGFRYDSPEPALVFGEWRTLPLVD